MSLAGVNKVFWNVSTLAKLSLPELRVYDQVVHDSSYCKHSGDTGLLLLVFLLLLASLPVRFPLQPFITVFVIWSSSCLVELIS